MHSPNGKAQETGRRKAVASELAEAVLESSQQSQACEPWRTRWDAGPPYLRDGGGGCRGPAGAADLAVTGDQLGVSPVRRGAEQPRGCRRRVWGARADRARPGAARLLPRSGRVGLGPGARSWAAAFARSRADRAGPAPWERQVPRELKLVLGVEGAVRGFPPARGPSPACRPPLRPAGLVGLLSPPLPQVGLTQRRARCALTGLQPCAESHLRLHRRRTRRARAGSHGRVQPGCQVQGPGPPRRVQPRCQVQGPGPPRRVQPRCQVQGPCPPRRVQPRCQVQGPGPPRRVQPPLSGTGSRPTSPCPGPAVRCRVRAHLAVSSPAVRCRVRAHLAVSSPAVRCRVRAHLAVSSPSVSSQGPGPPRRVQPPLSAVNLRAHLAVSRPLCLVRVRAHLAVSSPAVRCRVRAHLAVSRPLCLVRVRGWQRSERERESRTGPTGTPGQVVAWRGTARRPDLSHCQPSGGAVGLRPPG
nr:uncharacterized protein LOC127487950 [Oryctolagus cuniculus]